MNIGLANWITLLRLFMVPAMAVALIEERHVLAFALFIAAAISDAVDGIIARCLSQRTTLGAILDPLADKALLLTAFILTAINHPPFASLPVWLVVAVVFRDIHILAGIAIIHLITGHVRWGASWMSKINTNVQIYTIVAILLINALRELEIDGGLITLIAWILSALIWATLVTTIASGIDYTIRGVKMLSEQTDGAPPPTAT